MYSKQMHAFVKYVIFAAFTRLSLCFSIIWNVPSQKCLSTYGINFNLTKYGIISNAEEKFTGQEVNIFYETRPGLYPKFLPNGTEVNGGIPQNASLISHFVKAKSDIDQFIPYADFSGFAVIDWESWRPTFERNNYEEDKHIYIKKSLNLVKSQHPTWSEQKVFREAKRQFENAAENLMKGTLLLAKLIRPRGRWGFYGFPRCFNYRVGQEYCANDTKSFNDQIMWLFGSSSCLFPSIYLSSAFKEPNERRERVQGILNETLRIQGKFSEGTMPALAYTTFKYTDTHVYYTKNDVINTIGQSMDAGLDGAIVWGSSSDVSNRDDCQSLDKYIQEILGPMSKFMINFARICSAVLCNSHGKCVRANWLREPKVQFGSTNKMLKFDDYKCKCHSNWSGKHCQNN